jgi:hypothetical protein
MTTAITLLFLSIISSPLWVDALDEYYAEKRLAELNTVSFSEQPKLDIAFELAQIKPASGDSDVLSSKKSDKNARKILHNHDLAGHLLKNERGASILQAGYAMRTRKN